MFHSNRVIKQFIDDSWYETLEKSAPFNYTEAASDYVLLFNRNLREAANERLDTHFELSVDEQKERLLVHNFHLLYDEDDTSSKIYYKPGRLITQLGSQLKIIYQYQGKLPNLLTKSNSLNLDYDIFTDTFSQSTCIGSINTYMEENGKFIEPWRMVRFTEPVREILSNMMEFIPDNIIKKLFSV